MTNSEISPSGNSDIKLTLKRLCNSLYIAHALRPEKYHQWAETSSFDAYYAAMHVFLDESDVAHERTYRENLCLKASGLMIATYWMDIYPGRGVPNRANVEWFFRTAEYEEQHVVSPLALACATDTRSPMSSGQRTVMENVTVFSQLEPSLDELGPPHRTIDDEYVWPRTGPITREHIASVLQPTIAELGDALEQDGHYPYSQAYLRHVKDQLNS